MGFHYTKTKTLANGKQMIIIYYFGFWLDLRFLQVDYEQTLVSGCEVRQILNGRVFQSSVIAI